MSAHNFLPQFKTNSIEIAGDFWNKGKYISLKIEMLYIFHIKGGDDLCCICHKAKINETSGDSCSHTFCYDCILQWCRVKNQCPLCKRSIMKLILIK